MCFACNWLKATHFLHFSDQWYKSIHQNSWRQDWIKCLEYWESIVTYGKYIAQCNTHMLDEVLKLSNDVTYVLQFAINLYKTRVYIPPATTCLLKRIRRNALWCLAWMHSCVRGSKQGYGSYPMLERFDFSTLRPGKIPDQIFKCIFLNENARILIRTSLKIVPQVQLTTLQYWFR